MKDYKNNKVWSYADFLIIPEYSGQKIQIWSVLQTYIPGKQKQLAECPSKTGNEK